MAHKTEKRELGSSEIKNEIFAVLKNSSIGLDVASIQGSLMPKFIFADLEEIRSSLNSLLSEKKVIKSGNLFFPFHEPF